ncbi:MAG: hypothetical protein IPL53_06570 [Ignavibacteria bacterium]|nr:hypothetical protein [Ignavibacteria bacterium]
MYSRYKDKIIGYEMKNIPPVLLEWFSKDETEENVSGSLENFFKNNFEGKSDQVFVQNNNFPEAAEEDFNTQIVELGNGKFVVTVIALRKDAVSDVPLIELIFKNFKMTDIDTKEFGKLVDRYKMFKPGWIRYYEYDKGEVSEKIFDSIVENITIAGSINAVKHLPKSENYEKVKIEQLNSMDFYAEYSDEYDSFFESNEAMRNMIEKETFETMENILKDGKLFKAIIDGEFAGVFAIVKNKSLYFKSFFVREEILFKKFRGKGYASVFQRKVIESLPTDEIKIICGIIHSQNELSLQTAKSCGRSAMETSFLIKLKY